LTPGEIPKTKDVESCELGDIYLGVEKVQQYCEEHKIPLQDRLQYLMAHGICHLLGHKHNTDQSHTLVRSLSCFVSEISFNAFLRSWQMMQKEESLLAYLKEVLEKEQR